MSRTVYFHIGAGKTGTSAIQVALVRNRAILEAGGFLYPAGSSDRRAHLGLTTSGNGERLVALLKASTSAEDVDRVFKGSIGRLFKSHPDRSLIYSSELFVGCPLARFADLAGAVRAAGGDVKVIYYVRHLLDFAASRYGEMVKRNGYTETFETFIKKHRNNSAMFVRQFSGIVGAENMILRLYDREQPNLIAGFFGIFLGEEASKSNLSTAGAPINRSPTPKQIEMALIVNRLVAQIGKTAPSDRLADIYEAIFNTPADASSRFTVTPDELTWVRKRNAGVIAYFKKFAGDDFGLDFVGSSVAIGERPPPEWNDDEKVFIRGLTEAVEKRAAEGSWRRMLRSAPIRKALSILQIPR